MNLSREDKIWNRACGEPDGSSPAEGDIALAAMLLAHGLVMNGGVEHALEVLTADQLANALAGFEYFGLSAAAVVMAQVPGDTDEELDALDEDYWKAVPGDETLTNAFRVKLMADPQAFAPTVGGAHA